MLIILIIGFFISTSVLGLAFLFKIKELWDEDKAEKAEAKEAFDSWLNS